MAFQPHSLTYQIPPVYGTRFASSVFTLNTSLLLSHIFVLTISSSWKALAADNPSVNTHSSFKAVQMLCFSLSWGFTWPPYLKSHPPYLPNLSSCSAIFPITLSPPNISWNLCFMISVLFVSLTLRGYKLLERRIFFSIYWWFPKIYSTTWDIVDSW